MTARPDWDETWADVARVIARRSRCSRAQVGAVIVDPRNRVVSTGYNGPPPGWQPNLMSDELPVDYLDNCAHWCDRGRAGPTSTTLTSYVDCPANHAEISAIGFVDRRHCEGGTIYVLGAVCWTCAKAIATAGLKRVVIVSDGDRTYRSPETTYEFLERCGVIVEELETTNDKER